MTRFFFFFFGLSEWAISFLTGVGANLYDCTDDSKTIKIKDLGRAKKITVIVKCEEREISRCWCSITEYWPHKCSKRGEEKDKVESVLGRREVQHTAHPRSYVSVLSGGESIGGDEV